jgi:hypothetical protein
MLSEYTKRLKREIIMQFGAVTHTFDAETISCFIDKIKADGFGRNNMEEIELLVNTLKYSGSRDFGDTDILMQAVDQCFVSVGGFIEKEHKEIKARLDNLERMCNKYRVGRVYEDRKGVMAKAAEE